MLVTPSMSDLKKIASGSVKDIFEEGNGNLHFLFSDRVSVFDYGPVPETIAHRGEALARFAKILFKEISIPSLFLGDSELGPAGLRMKKASHPKFSLKSDEFTFIPLEVIFRLGVPEGSKLLKKGHKLFEKFDSPFIEYTTKLEAFDRPLTKVEAKSLLPKGMTIEKVDAFALDCALKLQKFFSECGLTLWDGKIEVAAKNSTGELFLIDAITPDELRLTLDAHPTIPLSKELLRRWYQKTLWPLELEKLKSANDQHWKQLAPLPPALGRWRSQSFSQMFLKLCEALEKKSPKPILSWIEAETLHPKVFVSGKGGRESALRWRLEKEGCEIIYSSEGADAILVSNDADLAHGLIDQLSHKGEWAVGPTKDASHVEWSKLFGKHIAEIARVPLARWTTSAEEARTKHPLPVIKQDGLAAGKGVVLPSTLSEFDETITTWAQQKLLFEERLTGKEASAFFWILPVGEDFKVEFLGAAQDYKRRFEKDEGPNTGGMGAKSPHPTLTPDEISKFKTWAYATAVALKQEGIVYSGVLFMGLLNDVNRGWILLEYNARFGDPETQALVTQWENPKFLRAYLGLSLEEDLSPHLSDGDSLCIALVHPTYPQPGEPLSIAEWKLEDENAKLFLSGSHIGRIAYLTVKGLRGEKIGLKAAEILETSPWKDKLSWRTDILE